MSVRKRRLFAMPDARQDLRDILLYTEGRWDKHQVKIYKTKLDHAIRSLTRFPYRGEAQDEVSPGLRGLHIESHIMYYRVDDQSVNVVRVLHGAIDAASRIRP